MIPKVGPDGPPRKSVTMIADMVTAFMNSARKNMANRIEEYSVWKPPTSSCSASTRSNGGRFSSAVPAMMKMTNGTMPVIQRFHRSPYWPATIWLVESIPPISRTVAMESPRAAS